MTVIEYAEIVSTIFSLLFLYFLIKRKRVAWLYGIVSSVLAILPLYNAKLYSESILYGIYIGLGIYGYSVWNSSTEDNTVQRLKFKKHILYLVSGISTWLILSYLMDRFTDAARPFIDAATTVFGIVATLLEAHRYLAAWVYWIILNMITIVLYFDRELNFFTGLYIIYFLFSIYGYWSWKNELNIEE